MQSCLCHVDAATDVFIVRADNTFPVGFCVNIDGAAYIAIFALDNPPPPCSPAQGTHTRTHAHTVLLHALIILWGVHCQVSEHAAKYNEPAWARPGERAFRFNTCLIACTFNDRIVTIKKIFCSSNTIVTFRSLVYLST